LAIDYESFEIYYNQAKLVEEQRISELTGNRTVKVKFEDTIYKSPWNNLIEKVICIEIDDYFYITRK